MKPGMEDGEHVQVPEVKKLKMSGTSTCSDVEDHDLAGSSQPDEPSAEKKTRYKRRKIAILFAYRGVGYQGMQKNPGAKTIEGDLEEALYHSGAISGKDRGCPKRVGWARSARTDKGVSAVGQVVSGRFYIDPPGLIERLNSHLPDQIRVFGYKRVISSFSSKKFCDRRRYVYLIPVFALDPRCHRDRESVEASVGSNAELVKCVACSERGRKVFSVRGNANGTESVSSSDNGASVLEMLPRPGQECPERISDDPESEMDDCNGGARFHYGEAEKERFNSILKNYVGTHNFHNFTTRTKAEDPSAKRYIISFEANSIVIAGGTEFVNCEVVGQSFMLHQIRKMIGLAVSVMRNFAPEQLFQTIFEKNVRITVPTAPELGLFLDECFFTSYNQKWNESHEEMSMEAYEAEAEEFRQSIHTHIASTEQEEGVLALWLHSLNRRNYPDLVGTSENDPAVPDDGMIASSDSREDAVVARV